MVPSLSQMTRDPQDSNQTVDEGGQLLGGEDKAGGGRFRRWPFHFKNKKAAAGWEPGLHPALALHFSELQFPPR